MTKIRKKNVNCNPVRQRRDVLSAVYHDGQVANEAQRLAALLLIEPARPKLSVGWLADRTALTEREVRRAIRQLHSSGHLAAIASCWPPEEVAA